MDLGSAFRTSCKLGQRLSAEGGSPGGGWQTVNTQSWRSRSIYKHLALAGIRRMRPMKATNHVRGFASQTSYVEAGDRLNTAAYWQALLEGGIIDKVQGF
jgi:hypothetical protein